MLQAMARLITKSDVLRVGIALLVFLAVWGIVGASVQGTGRILWPAIFGGLFLIVAIGTASGLHGRATKLMSGRCPHPLCHGTVHHSERVRRGQLVCPTCGNTWPEVEGIKFRATGRVH